MSQSILCPHCQRQLSVRDELAGKRLSCPHCKGAFVAPPEPEPEPEASSPLDFLSSPSSSSPRRTSKPVSREAYVHSSPKNSGTAAVLSFLWPGLGQIYNGEIGKGLIFVMLNVVFSILCFFLIGIPMLLILWIGGIYDAYNMAEIINRKAKQQSRYFPTTRKNSPVGLYVGGGLLVLAIIGGIIAYCVVEADIRVQREVNKLTKSFNKQWEVHNKISEALGKDAAGLREYFDLSDKKDTLNAKEMAHLEKLSAMYGELTTKDLGRKAAQADANVAQMEGLKKKYLKGIEEENKSRWFIGIRGDIKPDEANWGN